VRAPPLSIFNYAVLLRISVIVLRARSVDVTVRAFLLQRQRVPSPHSFLCCYPVLLLAVDMRGLTTQTSLHTLVRYSYRLWRVLDWRSLRFCCRINSLHYACFGALLSSVMLVDCPVGNRMSPARREFREVRVYRFLRQPMRLQVQPSQRDLEDAMYAKKGAHLLFLGSAPS
jgi:hypothetical protein